MTEQSDRDYEEIVEQADRYRERADMWKIGYYTNIITISAAFIGVCSLNQPVNQIEFLLKSLVVCLSILSCVGVIWNIEVYFSMFNKLGYTPTPKTPEEWKQQMTILEGFKCTIEKQGKRRRRIDKALKFSAIINIILLGGAYLSIWCS